MLDDHTEPAYTMCRSSLSRFTHANHVSSLRGPYPFPNNLGKNLYRLYCYRVGTRRMPVTGLKGCKYTNHCGMLLI
jgi:hypothetical protein